MATVQQWGRRESISAGEKPGRAAIYSHVQAGSTPQFGGKPLPLMLTPAAAKPGGQIYFFQAQISRIPRTGWLTKVQRCIVVLSDRCSGAGEMITDAMQWHLRSEQSPCKAGVGRSLLCGGSDLGCSELWGNADARSAP